MATKRAGAEALGWLLLATLGCGGREPLTAAPVAGSGTAGAGGGAQGAAGATTGAAGATTGAAGAVTGAAGATTGAAGATPAPAADEWIFFDSLLGTNRDIYAVQPDGSALRRVTTSPATEREPAVSRDGLTLAYSSDVTGTFQVYLVALPTGAPRQLTHEAQGAGQPAWSPDGARIAYAAGGVQVTTIVVIDAQGTNETRLAGAAGPAGDGHPAFTINGGAVLFDSYNLINRIDLTSLEERSVVPGFTGPVQHPTPSPDGLSFAFNNMCESSLASIWVDPLAGPVSACMSGSRMTAPGDFVRFPSFSPSGRLAVEHGNAVARIGVLATGRTVKDVTDGKGDERNPSWAPATTPVPSL